MCCEFTISDPPGIDFKEELRVLHNLIYREISIWGFSVKSDFLFIKYHEPSDHVESISLVLCMECQGDNASVRGGGLSMGFYGTCIWSFDILITSNPHCK